MKRNDVRNIGGAGDKEASVGDRVNCVSVPDVKRLIAFRNVTFVPTTILQTGWGGVNGNKGANRVVASTFQSRVPIA